MKKISLITIAYALLLICSLVLLLIYKLLFKDKTNKRAIAVFISTSITIVGYLLLSFSKTLPAAIWANRISYIGTIFLLLELLNIINDFCGIKILKKLFTLIMVVSLLVLMLVLTGGTSINLYYNSVSINIENNLTILIKKYGPLHNIYLIYVCFMYFSFLGSIIWSTFKNKTKIGVNPIVLLILVGENIFIWIVERYIGAKMQLLTISYVFTEILLILLLKNIEDYKKFAETVKEKEPKSVQKVIDIWSKDYSLTEREIEILNLLIENVARSDIAKALFISEHTVKKHTTHIYEKLCVTSRNDLLYKLNEEIAK